MAAPACFPCLSLPVLTVRRCLSAGPPKLAALLIRQCCSRPWQQRTCFEVVLLLCRMAQAQWGLCQNCYLRLDLPPQFVWASDLVALAGICYPLVQGGAGTTPRAFATSAVSRNSVTSIPSILTIQSSNERGYAERHSSLSPSSRTDVAAERGSDGCATVVPAFSEPR